MILSIAIEEITLTVRRKYNSFLGLVDCWTALPYRDEDELAKIFKGGKVSEPSSDVPESRCLEKESCRGENTELDVVYSEYSFCENKINVLDDSSPDDLPEGGIENTPRTSGAFFVQRMAGMTSKALDTVVMGPLMSNAKVKAMEKLVGKLKQKLVEAQQLARVLKEGHNVDTNVITTTNICIVDANDEVKSACART
ncbi:hypothetical protein V6N12_069232 [Hibiscus sabdariffa]|uniref:Uncharacterized protein n=1 Tax=Hibiscus sabdariffa TaxID=183260 RepID=A0ABR2FDA0_9ROSI